MQYIFGLEPGSGIYDQCLPATAKTAVMRREAHYAAPVGLCSKAVVGPLTSAQLTTVLLEGGDIIRGRASDYRISDIINKLTLLKEEE